MSEDFREAQKVARQKAEVSMDPAERKRRARKHTIRLLYLGMRYETGGEKTYDYADITKVFNHGLPLDEENVTIRKYKRSLDRSEPGAIFEYQYVIGPIGELQLLAKTRTWRGSWQNTEDIDRWQVLHALSGDVHFADHNKPRYQERQFRQKVQVFRMIYLTLTPKHRLLFIARIVSGVTGGFNETIREEEEWFQEGSSKNAGGRRTRKARSEDDE